MENNTLTLAPIFAAVGESLRENRDLLNRGDPVNGNHGDHMVEIFQIAARAAAETPGASLADVMESAAARLETCVENGSAQIYARGLRQIAGQVRLHQVTLDELVETIRGALDEGKTDQEPGRANGEQSRKGAVLKSLLSGLAGWTRLEEGKDEPAHPLDLSAMLEFGMAYMQARQRHDERADVLADAAASASPLAKSPHRYQSGVIAIRALLQAMRDSPG